MKSVIIWMLYKVKYEHNQKNYYLQDQCDILLFKIMNIVEMNTYKIVFKQQLYSNDLLGSYKNIYSSQALINLLEALDV